MKGEQSCRQQPRIAHSVVVVGHGWVVAAAASCSARRQVASSIGRILRKAGVRGTEVRGTHHLHERENPLGAHSRRKFEDTQQDGSAAKGTGFRDLKMLMPAHDSLPTTQLFSDNWAALMKPFDHLRWMGSTGTNQGATDRGFRGLT